MRQLMDIGRHIAATNRLGYSTSTGFRSEINMWGETSKYQPFRDSDERVIEDVASYARRMKSGVLPEWPEEVLVEWLYEHADFMWKYVSLGFETFSFLRNVGRWKKFPVERLLTMRDFVTPSQTLRKERATHTIGSPIICYGKARGIHL